MKTMITTLQDALGFQLQGLFYAEKKVKEELKRCSNNVTSTALKRELIKYADAADNKLLKLERIFNYLMQEPLFRKNEVINKLLEEAHQLLSYTYSSHLKDILMIGCIQNINAYKVTSYKTFYLFAVELELDTAADLLQQILEWEIETEKALANLALDEFNKMPQNV